MTQFIQFATLVSDNIATSFYVIQFHVQRSGSENFSTQA